MGKWLCKVTGAGKGISEGHRSPGKGRIFPAPGIPLPLSPLALTLLWAGRTVSPSQFHHLAFHAQTAWAEGQAGGSYGAAAEDTLVGQAGREQLVGTEHLSMLVHGPIVLAGLRGGAEPRGGVWFCGWGGEGGRRK